MKARAPRSKKRQYHTQYSRKALDKRAVERYTKLSDLDKALEWCEANNKRARAAETYGKKTGEFKVTYNEVHPRLQKKKKTSAHGQHTQIMTDTERKQVAEWIMECADGNKPQYRTDITVRIRTILRGRVRDNKKKKYGTGSVKLNSREQAVLASDATQLSNTFFQHFYAWCRARGLEVDEGTPKTSEAKRAAKMTESVIDRHFNGKFGLQAELRDAGVMDKDSDVINDPRRLLNCDETPQPMDMRARVAAAQEARDRAGGDARGDEERQRRGDVGEGGGAARARAGAGEEERGAVRPEGGRPARAQEDGPAGEQEEGQAQPALGQVGLHDAAGREGRRRGAQGRGQGEGGQAEGEEAEGRGEEGRRCEREGGEHRRI